MALKHIACSPFVNNSERHATEYIKARLQEFAAKDDWVLLSNYSSSSNQQYLSDELDLVIVGPPGVIVVETKHWSPSEMKGDRLGLAEAEADKLNAKAKRLKGQLTHACRFNVGFVAGKYLFTKNTNKKLPDGALRNVFRGIEVFQLGDWKDLVEVHARPILSKEEIGKIVSALEPNALALGERSITVFNDSFFDLTPVPSFGEPFRRVFKARRKEYRDKVLLHIYDLSASDDPNAFEVARRESEALIRLQKFRWVPNLMDSFQEATRYPGEIFFFTCADTEAPSLQMRAADENWNLEERVYSTLHAVDALADMHEISEVDGDPILHRNLSPDSIYIKSNNEPLFTQLFLSKLPGAKTVAGSDLGDGKAKMDFFAPEVREQGIGFSSVASDVYSLCASLKTAFVVNTGEDDEEIIIEIRKVLERGTQTEPSDRASLRAIYEGILSIVQPGPPPKSEFVPVDLWDEDTILNFNNRNYKVITRLGSGGFGTTFKVMEVNAETQEEESGPYVAKVVTQQDVGAEAARAYAKVRGQAGGPNLAGVLEVATTWQPHSITALLKWVEGQPLDELAGVLPLYFEDIGLDFNEATLLGWAGQLCEALRQLHEVRLVHGDVSPRNIIVKGGSLTLIDFDTARQVGSVPLGGTPPYCSPEISQSISVEFSDDLYALAATLFYCAFDKAPFVRAGAVRKDLGLCWADTDIQNWPKFHAFCEKATTLDRAQRFTSAMEAINFVHDLEAGDVSLASAGPRIAEVLRHENIVPWLSQLLQSYPGSPKGNAETRGLDSQFARLTYVKTDLDGVVLEDIQNRKVSLVILCGNAGDGKTAFLQNLADNLGLKVGNSAQRIWDEKVDDDLKLYANLDGSASYEGRSANELLDVFFSPFIGGEFPQDIIHLLAINDGKLLEWLEDAPQTNFTEFLYQALSDDVDGLPSRMRFIDLNKRSLVGGYRMGTADLVSPFVDHLISRMVEPDEDVWEPCLTCTAQPRCHAWRSVSFIRDADRGQILRERLTKALIAVHQRGEIHITARSLRAALVYIFFGTKECSDLHANPDFIPEQFWDRTFAHDSPHRQGDLLNEIARLDPALDAHPRIDEFLLKGDHILHKPGEYMRFTGESLDSLRREAFLLSSDEELSQVAKGPNTLTLANAEHLSDFLVVASGNDVDRKRIANAVCDGIARLEDLPEEAFSVDPSSVPLKITPRTPTETSFWVSKSRDRFTLAPKQAPRVEGIEALHTHITLAYGFESGHQEELIIGAELFNLLMELRNGLQIADAQSDDVFANLSIFKQRLAQENDRLLYAWNPASESVLKIEAEFSDGVQKLMLRPLQSERPI